MRISVRFHTSGELESRRHHTTLPNVYRSLMGDIVLWLFEGLSSTFELLAFIPKRVVLELCWSQ